MLEICWWALDAARHAHHQLPAVLTAPHMLQHHLQAVHNAQADTPAYVYLMRNYDSESEQERKDVLPTL